MGFSNFLRMLQQVFQKPDGLGIVVAVGQPLVNGQTQIQRFLHGGAALLVEHRPHGLSPMMQNREQVPQLVR